MMTQTKTTTARTAFPFLVWIPIVEFLDLESVLTLRLICREWQKSLEEELSATACARFLLSEFQKQNAYVMNDTSSWNKRTIPESWTRHKAIQECLSSKQSQSQSPVQIMLHCFRLLKVLPREFAVAFNKPFGRHCLAMEWSDTEHQALPKVYEPCQRRLSSCVTCHDPIPTKQPSCCASAPTTSTASKDDKTEEDMTGTKNEIDDHFRIMISTPSEGNHKRTIADISASPPQDDGQRQQTIECLNLSEYFPLCVPNLPPDLICPVCACQDQRTLVMSEISYHATTTNGDDLGFAPSLADRFYTTTTTTTVSSSYHRKRRKLDPSILPAFPPMVQDVSIPNNRNVSQQQQDAHHRHALSIHCVACRQFGIISPAVPCFGLSSSQQDSCWNQSRNTMIVYNETEEGDGVPTMLGRQFVRRKCDDATCNRAVLCHCCSRNSTIQLHCTFCQLHFCEEHAWQSTVCHHW